MNSLLFDQIEIGQEASFSHSFSSNDINAFAALSGDYSPIHMDTSAAAARSLSDRVVHGLLTASLISRMVGVYLPGSTALLHGLEIYFTSPVYPGDELQITGVVISKQEAYKEIKIKIEIKNQNGKRVVRAKVWTAIRA